MIWFVVLVVLLVVIVLVAGTRSGRSSGESKRELSELPRRLPAIAVVQQSPPPSRPAPAGDVLQPFSPIPLTVLDASPEAVTALRAILEDTRSWGRDRQERILGWLLTTNAHIREVDVFIAEWAPKFQAEVATLSESDPDWATASELDREDILGEATKKALVTLDTRAHELDYEIISRPPSLVATADDELLARYSFELLSFYFRNAEDLDRVHTVPSDDWERSRYESLVKRGLARRGADIPAAAMLTTLTLKEMEQLATDVAHKRFTRRAGAIEFLSAIPDLRERLAKLVSMRELFQLVPLPPEFAHLELALLGHAWAFTTEYAKLIEVTYATATQVQEAVRGVAYHEQSLGWRVESAYADQPCCPSCARQSGDHRGKRTPPRLPHHVGCVCRLSEIYE